MPWPKRLVFARHAESIGNTLTADERALYEVPTYAYPLTQRGRQQAEITGQYLKKRFGEFDVYHTSYYERSKETMRIMYPNANVQEDPRLAEVQRGIWHTMTKAQIQTHFPFEIPRKEREGLYHYRPLGGENWPDAELRVRSYFETLILECSDLNVFDVVHGNWLILFDRLVRHSSIEDAVQRYKSKTVANASVTIYTGIIQNGRPTLVLSEDNIIPWQGIVS